MNDENSLKYINTLRLALYEVDKNRTLDESDLEEFIQDWEGKGTNKFDYKKRDVQHYKTWTEFFKFNQYDANDLLPKYHDAVHPLINAVLCNALMNAGRYPEALNFLGNGLLYAMRFPHLYWHNERGMLGCCMLLWDLVWMIDHRHDHAPLYCNDDYWEMVARKSYKLLYMTLTRTIDMAPDMPQTCDLLSNRADLAYHQSNRIMALFSQYSMMVSWDVQFIADKKATFIRSTHFPGLSGIYSRQLNESKMMYEYGCLHPTETSVSPKYREDDATWDDLVKRGIQRADILSANIYDEFFNHKLDFNRSKVEEIIIALREIYHNISTKSDFDTVISVLKDVFDNTGTAKVQDLISALSENKKLRSISCYSFVLDYLQANSHKYQVVGLHFLTTLESAYSKIERDYNWNEHKGSTIFSVTS